LARLDRPDRAAPPVGAGGTLRTMGLVTAIYVSAFTGRPVRPADPGSDSPFHQRMGDGGAGWPR
jgi:hypothetical protein